MMSDSNPETSSPPPVERVRQEIDRWLDAVRSTGERTLESLGLAGINRPATPPIDIVELPDEIQVFVDLPGISAESVELTIVGNMLTIAATRRAPDFSNDARFHLRERAVGRYQRSIPLPAAVNDEAIRAETRDGLLIVTLRKSMPGPGRSIPVARGSGEK
jgi:HSP20 family protein